MSAARLPRLLAGVAAAGWLDLDGHERVHGPMPAVARGRSRGGEELIGLVEQAGLRGRGGAGYPTAVKMHAVAGARGRGRSVVVNAVEREPASTKDATLLEVAPHLVLDGATLAARAVGARRAIVCVAEGGDAAAAASGAINERGGLREDVELTLVEVGGGFVSGQESAVVSFVNGGAAKPTFTPPRVFERGVGGRPTLLSNAETLAHVALIARHGPEWYRSVGTPQHPGSMLVTLSGPVGHPGVYEIEHGSSLRSLLDAAGGEREAARAVLVGGYAGTWIDARDAAAMTIDDGWLAAHSASTGAGVVALLGEGACPVAETVRVTRWLADESAGQCGPCLFGLDALASRLEGWAWERDVAGEAEVLRLASVIRGRGACRHPDGTLRFVASALQVFAAEFEEHSRLGPCEGCSEPVTLPLPRTRAHEPVHAGARA